VLNVHLEQDLQGHHQVQQQDLQEHHYLALRLQVPHHQVQQQYQIVLPPLLFR